ncbi:MerR family transcriptional regulator [Allorhizobium sp. NPDC080224]|uniref:MerR family transcriptional regulator n=1 Tax=Allorhizobium sp. NPDC080224 TaxID=3390547 RepID=UPI003D00423C
MQIGELARVSGVHLETIRYYEREGVLPRAARQANGRRVYAAADAQRLGFIRHARELGFELSQVRALLALQEQPEASCAEASRMAEAQLEAVESRIVRLTALREELRRMVGECRKGAVAECRVIEVLGEPAPTLPA